MKTPKHRTKTALNALLLAAAGLLTASAGAETVVSPAAAKAAIDTSTVQQLEQQVKAAGSSAALADTYRAIRQARLDPAGEDFLLYQTAIALRSQPRSGEAEALVNTLKAHASQAFVALPDAGRELTMPL